MGILVDIAGAIFKPPAYSAAIEEMEQLRAAAADAKKAIIQLVGQLKFFDENFYSQFEEPVAKIQYKGTEYDAFDYMDQFIQKLSDKKNKSASITTEENAQYKFLQKFFKGFAESCIQNGMQLIERERALKTTLRR